MRRRMVLPWLAMAAAAAFLLAACGDDGAEGSGDNGDPAGGDTPAATSSGDGASDDSWGAAHVAPSLEGSPVTPVNINSNLGVGENRFALALFGESQTPVGDATVEGRFYRLAERPDEQPEVADLVTEGPFEKRSLVPSTDHVHEDGTVHRHEADEATMFVMNATFDEPGWWGLSADIEMADGTRQEGAKLRFFVQEDTSEPSVGDPVPPTRQPTLADVEDISLISSATEPNPEMVDQTVAEALESGEPFVVAFVTPAFCQTQFCGPVLEQVLVPVWEDYGDRISVLHIEPYDLERARQGEGLFPVEATVEWGLQSEPFVFVVDADGNVAAKFEGIMEADEVRAAVEEVLADAE